MVDEPTIIVENIGKTFEAVASSHSFKQLFVSAGRSLVGKKEHSIHSKAFTALRDINFTVARGEFLGIVGRNGSGKSTLLKILAGVYTPTKGRVVVNGQLTPFIELGVGFNPELSGRDNVYLNGALLGFTHKQMQAMYKDIVAFAELEKFMDVKLKNYSSGMQVRLAFSVAIRADSDVLIIDEVLAVGDAAFQRKCYDYFMDLKKKNRTVVLVTHDMGAVRQYCDRAILIDNSRIVETGSAEDVAQAYQRMFSGEAAQENDDKPVKSNRWGNGRVRAGKPEIVVGPDELVIKTSYAIRKEIMSLIAGFSIYGPDGQNILESNTIHHKYDIKDLQVGTVINFEWRLPNVFASGKYEVSVACCDKSTTDFYDWVNKAATFRIKKEFLTSGIVNPAVEMKRLENTLTEEL